MIIERTNPFTGKVNRMDLPVSRAQIERWQNGACSQDAFPNLNPNQREFIQTGLLPEDWTAIFGDVS